MAHLRRASRCDKSREDPRAQTGTPALRAEMTNPQTPNDQSEWNAVRKRTTGDRSSLDRPWDSISDPLDGEVGVWTLGFDWTPATDAATGEWVHQPPSQTYEEWTENPLSAGLDMAALEFIPGRRAQQ
jgi:hypothetical protein